MAALLAAFSKKAHVLVAFALLVALLAAVASAGKGDLLMTDGQCTRVGACSDSLCTEQYCSVHDTGSCKFVGQYVYCCCGPVHSTSTDDVHPRPLGH
ncbi:hypothetical protein SETIT_8G064000v2 [Setaria italica]|uniref:Knottin scorpion toxin-like domain-containing protein n=2 Tax=Setaria TaxID=4554 RepID=A0A368S6H7_SETIT|nr:hypothetical protein SETIT_8G064000v2 [Setaria italica]TKV99775.1 hypothetical protein SEVIR_8G066200v2 [Setaria viridis]